MIFFILAVLILAVFIILNIIACIKKDENIFYASLITVTVGVLIWIIAMIVGSIYLNHFSDFPTTTEKKLLRLLI